MKPKRKKLCLILTFFSISAILIITTNIINSTWKRKNLWKNLLKNQSMNVCKLLTVISPSFQMLKEILVTFSMSSENKKSLEQLHASHCWNEYYFSKKLTNSDRNEVFKETQFWVHFYALLEENIYVPSVNNLGA